MPSGGRRTALAGVPSAWIAAVLWWGWVLLTAAVGALVGAWVSATVLDLCQQAISSCTHSKTTNLVVLVVVVVARAAMVALCWASVAGLLSISAWRSIAIALATLTTETSL